MYKSGPLYYRSTEEDLGKSRNLYWNSRIYTFSNPFRSKSTFFSYPAKPWGNKAKVKGHTHGNETKTN